MEWTFNRDYRDKGQVEAFYPEYLAIREELESAGQYPYNEAFNGRIPGIAGPDEDTAIYLLQQEHSLRELDATLAARRADGWRDLPHEEITDTPQKFAGVALYGFYVGGTGWRQWDNARVRRYGSGVMILPAGRRTNGHIAAGRLLVLDRG